MVRMVVTVAAMVMILIAGKPLLRAYYVLSRYVIIPFILTTALGGRFSYYPHCIEEETEALRGYYFPRSHW